MGDVIFFYLLDVVCLLAGLLIRYLKYQLSALLDARYQL